ncbi:hypothetical protein [Priestia aryabhattai]|uniref:hypothetical protein n=1 Tax=Priestia aryabhattai TaxID=412384 RepID=UPI003D26B878
MKQLWNQFEQWLELNYLKGGDIFNAAFANLQMMNWLHFPLIHYPLRNRPQMNAVVIL